MNKLYITLIVISILLLIPLSSFAHENASNQSVKPYKSQEINYFTEIALGFEYGSASKVIRKWDEDIRIKVTGTPSVADMIALFRVVTELDAIIGDKINISIVQEDEYSNVEIYFGKMSTFSGKVRGYVSGNWGYFYVNYNSNNYIYKAKILVATDETSQQDRNAIILEELTQSIGMAQDSYLYPDSVFQQNYTTTDTYSELDRRIIQMLYLDEIKVGMDKEQVINKFKELNEEILNKQ